MTIEITMEPVEEVFETFYIKWTTLSCFCCLFIHHIISPMVFNTFCQSYRSLKKAKRMEWDSRIVSTVHAIIVSSLCIYALVSEPEIWTNRISHGSVKGMIALSITVGYFICDMISMPMYWRGKSLIIFLIHHSVSAIAFAYATNIQQCIFYCAIRLTSELSTPFVNQRWLYLTIGLTHKHKRVAYSTLVFTVLFSIVRNWLIVPYWIMVYLDYGTEAHINAVKRFPFINFVWLGCASVLDMLNVYWGPAVYRNGRRAFQTVHPTFSLKCLFKWNYNSDDDELDSELSDAVEQEVDKSSIDINKND